MPNRNIARLLAPLVIAACSSFPAVAQDWGNKMIERREIKFGSVARLAETSFKVKVQNPFQEEIRISSLTTSCGCISWHEAGQTPISIPSKGERELTINLDTVRHAGEKHVRAFVALYEPTKGLSSTVTIPVDGRIRSDFEVTPSNVGFGTIDLGTAYIQRITINYLGGRSDWKIVQARTTNPHFTAQVIEKSRNGGSATYEAVVRIDANVPAGSLRDQLILTTNEGIDPTISIPIQATVEPDVVVTDAQFGTVTPGVAKSVNVIVRGKRPFKIARIEHVERTTTAKPEPDGTISTNSGATVSDAITIKTPTNAAAVHMLQVILTAPINSGVFDEEFAVVIEGRPQPLRFKAKGRVVGQEVTTIPN